MATCFWRRAREDPSAQGEARYLAASRGAGGENPAVGAWGAAAPHY